jgi:type 1 fimbriae regulatory protein FimB/type 1 fimbriae regulatory protein FimE
MKPDQIKQKLPPRKPKNADRRSNQHLTPEDVDRLINAARSVGRHGHRDATLILVAYIHALRVSELIGLVWNQVDFDNRKLNVHRINRGLPSVQSIAKNEIDALLKLREKSRSDYVFCSERGGPLNRRSVVSIIARAGKVAKLSLSVHPYMIRHARGYELAAKGIDIQSLQAYMGHRHIQHTAVYKKSASQEMLDFED